MSRTRFGEKKTDWHLFLTARRYPAARRRAFARRDAHGHRARGGFVPSRDDESRRVARGHELPGDHHAFFGGHDRRPHRADVARRFSGSPKPGREERRATRFPKRRRARDEHGRRARDLHARREFRGREHAGHVHGLVVDRLRARGFSVRRQKTLRVFGVCAARARAVRLRPRLFPRRRRRRHARVTARAHLALGALSRRPLRPAPRARARFRAAMGPCSAGSAPRARRQPPPPPPPPPPSRGPRRAGPSPSRPRRRRLRVRSTKTRGPGAVRGVVGERVAARVAGGVLLSAAVAAQSRVPRPDAEVRRGGHSARRSVPVLASSAASPRRGVRGERVRGEPGRRARLFRTDEEAPRREGRAARRGERGGGSREVKHAIVGYRAGKRGPRTRHRRARGRVARSASRARAHGFGQRLEHRVMWSAPAIVLWRLQYGENAMPRQPESLQFLQFRGRFFPLLMKPSSGEEVSSSRATVLDTVHTMSGLSAPRQCAFAAAAVRPWRPPRGAYMALRAMATGHPLRGEDQRRAAREARFALHAGVGLWVMG